MTIWLPTQYPGYEISSDGQLRTVDRLARCRANGQRTVRGQVRKAFLVKGYLHCAIGVNGHKVNVYIHTLVCEAFHGPRPSPDHEVRHLNGIPTDNRAENLTWGTKSENAQDSIRHGNNKQVNKTHCRQGHPYDEANTVWWRGKRLCRECRYVWRQRYYAKNREAVLEQQRSYRRRRAAR